MVRAKFRVVSVKKEEYMNGGGEVKLEPVYAGSEENDRYFYATPCGEIRIGTINERAVAQFEVGKEFYVDFTPAEAV